jgi:hypothetical protein
MSWSGTERHFVHDHRSGKIMYWSIGVMDEHTCAIVTVNHSWLGGKIQEACEEIKGINFGKKNEKKPFPYALERAEKTIQKKLDEGYQEIPLNLLNQMLREGPSVRKAPKARDTIDFDNPPKDLCFYKPYQTMTPAMEKKAANSQVIYSRKRNGHAFIFIKNSAGIGKFYSRRMEREGRTCCH